MDFEELPQPEREALVSPDELEVDGENPNSMSDEQFGLLCDRMRKQGWLGGPILTNLDGLIADGEHRWRAAQEIELDEVPVRQYDIDDATRRLWRQQMNKNEGEHDSKRDALEYDYLLNHGMSDEVQSLTRAAGEDLDELLEEIKLQGDRQAQYEYNPEHNVYFEDCVGGMRERLDDNSVDMVFTSPPYNVSKGQHQDRDTDAVAYEDNKTIEEFREFIGTVASELVRVTKDTGHIFINLDPQYGEGYIESHKWLRDAVPAPLRSVIIWKKDTYHKPQLAMRGQFQRDYEPIYHFSIDPSSINELKAPSIWDVPTAVSDGVDEYGAHPAPYSVALVEEGLRFTTSEGDTILDPFMGSGTTAVAAIQNDRDYVGFELDEEGAYKPIIERRIAEAKRAKDASVNQEQDSEPDHDHEKAEADD
jgi:DNA modification methylase